MECNASGDITEFVLAMICVYSIIRVGAYSECKGQGCIWLMMLSRMYIQTNKKNSSVINIILTRPRDIEPYYVAFGADIL